MSSLSFRKPKVGIPRRRILTFSGLLASLLLAMAFLPAPPADARSSDLVIEYYYSDAAMTDEVGFRIMNRCGGGSGPLHGEVGPYCRVEKDPCRPSGGGTVKECFIYEWVPCGNGNQCVTNFWSISCPP